MSLTRVLCTLALCGTALAAQDFRFGLQGSGYLPTGDLKTAVDNAAGFGGGVFMLVDFKGGHVLRPRVDGLQYSGKDTWWMDEDNGKYYKINCKVKELQVGADYLYFLDKEVKGLYFLVGVAFTSNKNELTFVEYMPGGKVRENYADTTNGVGGAAGAGWQFTKNLGAEVKYTLGKFKKAGDSYNLGAAQVSVTLTF